MTVKIILKKKNNYNYTGNNKRLPKSKVSKYPEGNCEVTAGGH